MSEWWKEIAMTHLRGTDRDVLTRVPRLRGRNAYDLVAADTAHPGDPFASDWDQVRA